MVAAAVKLTAAAWVGKPCATMVTRHPSDRIETISAFLPLASAILSLVQWLVFVPHRCQVSSPAG
jgi:hypothetical protein